MLQQQLAEIHNALCQISTKGEDTITMAKCLITLRQLVQNMDNNSEEVTEDADNN